MDFIIPGMQGWFNIRKYFRVIEVILHPFPIASVTHYHELGDFNNSNVSVSPGCPGDSLGSSPRLSAAASAPSRSFGEGPFSYPLQLLQVVNGPGLLTPFPHRRDWLPGPHQN